MASSDSPPLLFLQGVRLTFGGATLLEGADLSVGAGERLCLVGRNGSGKSTLLKIAAGLIEADSGERFLQPGATIRYLPQEPDLSGFDTAIAYVEAGLGPADDPHRARYLLNRLGLAGDEDPAHLSGGEGRRCALARVLAPAPDILFLDEPTNHLDLPAIEWLETELAGLRSAVVLVSHDRRFLQNLSKAVVWLDRGITRRLDRSFEGFENWRDEILAQEETERHKLDRKLVREADWLRYGVTARRKRNQGRLAKLHAMRDERRNQRKVLGVVSFEISGGSISSGKLVAEAEHVDKSFGDTAVIRDFSTRITQSDRVAIVGPNGAGKTTLLNLLTGKLQADSGKIKLGINLELAYLDQGRRGLDPGMSLADALTGGAGDTVYVNGRPKHVIGHMQDFLFAPEQARTPIGGLSGGERGRLALARAITLPSNVLVLDEPTNDLDLETLDLLQEVIGSYSGAVLIVSHDRDFLDHVATSVIGYDGDGKWVEYAGGYSDMIAQRGKPLPSRPVVGEAKTSAKKARGDAPAQETRRKLSFKDKHALETLPAKIEKIQADIARNQAKFDDAGLYARDPVGFQKVSDDLARLETELAAAEEQWLALEMLREEMDETA